jgi:hypothetical protein
MDITNSKFDQHVAASGAPRYRHVSEGFAKLLRPENIFSTKTSPADMSGGQSPSGVVFCVDGLFGAKPRNAALKARNGGVDDYPATGEVIAMCEWPTLSRIRDIRVIASKATLGAAFNPLSADLDYFDANTAAAFPAFTLRAVDPNDSTFVPIPLLDDNTIATGVVVQQLSLAAIAYGINRRKDPLIIEVLLAGAVVPNSLLAVYASFVKPHV